MYTQRHPFRPEHTTVHDHARVGVQCQLPGYAGDTVEYAHTANARAELVRQQHSFSLSFIRPLLGRFVCLLYVTGLLGCLSLVFCGLFAVTTLSLVLIG